MAERTYEQWLHHVSAFLSGAVYIKVCAVFTSSNFYKI
jgi:hypothetical protein